MTKTLFLMVPDESEFGQRVLLVIGTCTIGRIINIIRESEINHLSMPWVTARIAQLLSCWKSTPVLASGSAEAQSEGASRGPQEVEMDELVMVGGSLHLGPFQNEIIAGWVKPLLGDTAHIMITPLKAEGQLWGSRPLSPGLHVLHVYTCLKNGSGKVFLIVRNVSDSYIFLKSCFNVTCATYRVITRDGSCSGHGILTQTHVHGSETGEAAGEIEPGWAGPLVPRKGSGGERASPGLP